MPSLTLSIKQTPLQKAKPKDDIPVPKIRTVESYNTDIPPDYDCPKSFVRLRRPTEQELRENLEYVIDAEDEVWLLNNTKFGGSCSSQNNNNNSSTGDDRKRKTTIENQEKGTFQLPLAMLETMMDVLEKATAFEAIITMDQAEHLICQKLPQLYHMYPIKARAGVVTIKHVLTDIYNYWVSKRSKLKRPLLRRFWPVTSSDDTNPHLVFRPREKEKYKLRKKRQNDMDAYRKLQQLKQDFQHVRVLLDLVKQREELNRASLLLQKEWYQQKIYDSVDTSGLPRISQDLKRDQLEDLLNVERHFDVHDGWKKNKKSRRGNQTFKSSSSRSTSPVPDYAGGIFPAGNNNRTTAGTTTANEASSLPLIIAGQNGGEPAPGFLHPLSTRETYATSWDNAVPHVTSFVDAHPLPTFRFRHRPRVGRGGRLCIDRMPLPVDPNISPVTYFRAGNAQVHAKEPKQRLLDLLPEPLDRESLSRRIEDICLTALKEDYEMHSSAPHGGHAPGVIDGEENDGEAVLVKVNDWLNTDEQYWGEERFSIGPI
jgi:enhancer of polycomb-like protein